MEKSVLHNRAEETSEAKARWFQSLTLEERMELLCMFKDMILGANPNILDSKDVKPVAGRIRVVSKKASVRDE